MNLLQRCLLTMSAAIAVTGTGALGGLGISSAVRSPRKNARDNTVAPAMQVYGFPSGPDPFGTLDPHQLPDTVVVDVTYKQDGYLIIRAGPKRRKDLNDWEIRVDGERKEQDALEALLTRGSEIRVLPGKRQYRGLVVQVPWTRIEPLFPKMKPQYLIL